MQYLRAIGGFIAYNNAEDKYTNCILRITYIVLLFFGKNVPIIKLIVFGKNADIVLDCNDYKK